MPLKLQNNSLLVLSLLVSVMLGFNLDVIPVSIMEARNFITAREMIVDDNWLLTTMNGEPRYQKPPLPSWICALFGLAFGIKSTMALRIPALIFIVITGYYSNLIAKELTKKRAVGFNTGLILTTSFYVIAIAFEAPSDIFTHGFMLMGIYQLVLLFKRYEAFTKRACLAGLFIGCSILCKGPVSLYVLFLPFLLAYGLSFRYRFSKQLLFAIVGCIVLALLIGGSWYLYVRLEDPEPFTRIAEKETGNWTSYNVRPFYYYWSFFVQSGMWTVLAFVSLIYPYFKKKVRYRKAYTFSFLWTVFSVILLSIIPEKKSRYLMPVLIPLALNIGLYLDYLIRKFKHSNDWQIKLPAYFHFGLMALIALGIPVALFITLGEGLSDYTSRYAILSLALVIIGIALIVQLRKKEIKNAFQLNILYFAVLLAVGLPLFNAFKAEHYNPPNDLLKFAKSEGLKVYAVGYISPEMIWAYGKKLEQLKSEKGISFPNATSFGILTDGLNERERVLIERRFQIKKQEIYDLNISEENIRGYKNRLRSEFYVLKAR